jgi:tetratricopeptide (TPR) repeat protein
VINAWESLGDAHLGKGDTESAIQSYASSLSLNPDNISLERRLQGLRFLRALDHGGTDAAVRLYREARDEDPRAYNENAMNQMGYSLLSEGRIPEAIEIFTLNTKAYLDSWNVWDSLAEAYMRNGNTEQAIRYYEMSLELNPPNDNGREILKRLRGHD